LFGIFRMGSWTSPPAAFVTHTKSLQSSIRTVTSISTVLVRTSCCFLAGVGPMRNPGGLPPPPPTRAASSWSICGGHHHAWHALRCSLPSSHHMAAPAIIRPRRWARAPVPLRLALLASTPLANSPSLPRSLGYLGGVYETANAPTPLFGCPPPPSCSVH
jgi:hypothetical protein